MVDYNKCITALGFVLYLVLFSCPMRAQSLDSKALHTVIKTYFTKWVDCFHPFGEEDIHMSSVHYMADKQTFGSISLGQVPHIKQRFLYFSPDSSIAVDIHPYAEISEKEGRYYSVSDVDNAVYVLFRNNDKSLGVFFSGPGAWPDDVYWLDADRFIILGRSYDRGSEQLHTPAPFVVMIDLPNATRYLYEIYNTQSTEAHCTYNPDNIPEIITNSD